MSMLGACGWRCFWSGEKMEIKAFVLYFALISLAAASHELQQHPGHGHDHDHEEEECTITDEDFSEVYSSLVEDMEIVDPETGESCSLVQYSNPAVSYQNLRTEYEVCETLFNFSQLLLLNLNASSECCLRNASSCVRNSTSEEAMSQAKAYGYGTLMVVVLCLLSLLGVIIVPLIKNHQKCGSLYEYVKLFLVAMGTSALFSDAILHLIPEVFEHAVEDNEGPDGVDEEALALAIIWRACTVTGGAYFFYLFEILLKKLMSHASPQEEKTEEAPDSNGTSNPDPSQKLLGDSHHTSFPRASIEESSESKYKTFQGTYNSLKQFKCLCVCDIKPLAVLIIVGDAFHNFIDGIALGAAISQSLALGFSTLIALVFHEVPHELGDFAILLSTGMKWYTALLFNFLSSLTSMAGFFIGVSVGLASDEATSWMLAIAAGTFFYIALVDLLPEIINHKLKGVLAVVLVNLGFVFSFVLLLLVAIYEDKFDVFD